MMQTFLPCSTFGECARTLDDRRLGKQRVETLQILRALVWPRYGWKRHPAVAMWRGFVPALVGYGVAVCREWRSRGHSDSILPSLLDFSGGVVPEEETLWEDDLLPPWLGARDLHLSHRSALVAKEESHYRTLFPDTPDGLPYVWPRPAFPHWPLRRGRSEPMAPVEASHLLGSSDTTPEQTALVERLIDGHDACLRLTEASDTTPGLLAGLCTPGETLWLVPGDPPPRPAAVADPGPLGVFGRPARSVARRPGPEDEVAMRAEGGEPEFRFRRVDPTTGTQVAVPPGVGLVVVEGSELPGPPCSVPVLRLLPPSPAASALRGI